MKEQQLNLNGRKIERLFRGLCIGIGLVLGAGTGVAIDNIGIVLGVGFMLGIAIYVYGIVNTSLKGFISDFSIGFLVGISALIILSTLLPMILHTSNVDSFALGIGNGNFVAFEYSGGEEGFGFSINPLPMLLFGGVMGLIYGLARSGKPAAKPENCI